MSDKIVASVGPIVKALIEAGVMPRRCRPFSLHLECDKAVRIVSECFATEDEVLAVAKALQDNPEEAKRIARQITLRDPVSSSYVRVEF